MLKALFNRVASSRQTPLQFEIDVAAIVAATMRDEEVGAASLEDVEGLDDLFTSVLGGSGMQRTDGDKPNQPTADASGELSEDLARWLATWLERCCAIVNDTHPQAMDVVGLRIEGYSDREIAAQLGMGMRLAARIVRDVLAACQADAEEE